MRNTMLPIPLLVLAVGCASTRGVQAPEEAIELGPFTAAVSTPICSLAEDTTPAAGQYVVVNTCPPGTPVRLDVDAIADLALVPDVGIGTASPSSTVDVTADKGTGFSVALELDNTNVTHAATWQLQNFETLFRITKTGTGTAEVSVDGSGDATIRGDVQSNGGVLALQETTSPTPLANYAKIFSTAANELWFQDGAGTDHLLHGDAFGSITHNELATASVATSTQNVFTKFTTFAVDGLSDDLGNVTPAQGTDDLTIGTNGAGKYQCGWHISATHSGGVGRTFRFAIAIDTNTDPSITNCTNGTPNVVTETGHGRDNGDMVTITGVLGHTACNGDWIIQTVDVNSYQLYDLAGTSTSGGALYTSGGTIPRWYPGSLSSRREVSQSALGMGGGGAPGAAIELAASDKVLLYAANLEGTDTLDVGSALLGCRRIGD